MVYQVVCGDCGEWEHVLSSCTKTPVMGATSSDKCRIPPLQDDVQFSLFTLVLTLISETCGHRIPFDVPKICSNP